ncbi:MAG TPA: hypothetical protein VFC63_04195 [Blastocatellia bacterium]|nr:hypothetical protein [Blastocatellia bacterium]
MNQQQSLNDYLEQFVSEHTLEDGDELLLKVSREDVEILGIFFLRGMCGWIRSINRSNVTETNSREELHLVRSRE